MINIKEDPKLNILNHSCAHLLAHAIKVLYPKSLFWVGPVIEEGFYYDVDLGNQVIKEEDLITIEKQMKKIIKDNKKFIKVVMTKQEALALFKEDKYKIDLIKDLEDEVSVYYQGDFYDLCRGPHLSYPKDLKHFKLLKVAGAYYKGDSNNKMLQRIYGVCFNSKEELDDYLNLLELAKQRDHRKLGRDLDLFYFSDLVGPGLPLYTPRGTIIKEELQKEIERICRGYGFQKVYTPHLANIKLYEISGHATKFAEELFHVTSAKGHQMVLKPVLCPHHTQIFASKIRSYRDLPIRYMESEKQYRAEMPGAVSGFSRVYAITIEDGHLFCQVSQVKEEVVKIVNIIKDFYSLFGLWGKHFVSLSVRDYNNPDKYIGEASDWDTCEQMLEEVACKLKLDAKRCEGEAALYGPKLDFMFKDAMGRDIQIPTVQLDFATPKRFDLTYIDKDGSKAHPVMIHRAILGSYERFIALLLEHYAGALPLWLSPVQINIIPINNKYHLEYANDISKLLINHHLRVEVDDRDQKLGYKIREHLINKIPYMIIIGDKEKTNNDLSYRKYGEEETHNLKIDQFINMILDLIKNKK